MFYYNKQHLITNKISKISIIPYRVSFEDFEIFFILNFESFGDQNFATLKIFFF
nr:MAG TPA: hypothetical protein [Caudoviricetes sp.]